MHELTEKITNVITFGSLNEKIDKLIREWLSEKAKELYAIVSNQYLYSEKMESKFKEILGLEPEKVEWCEHISKNYGGDFIWWDSSVLKGDMDKINFCPICGKSRPIEQSDKLNMGAFTPTKGFTGFSKPSEQKQETTDCL